MANDCYLWFRLFASKDTLDKVVSQLKTIGYNGCYGYSSVEIINNTICLIENPLYRLVQKL